MGSPGDICVFFSDVPSDKRYAFLKVPGAWSTSLLFKDLVLAFVKFFVSCSTDSGCLVAWTLEEFGSKLQAILKKLNSNCERK